MSLDRRDQSGPSRQTAAPDAFRARFEALTGDPPFPWQERLFDRLVRADFPDACNIPTGLGKTSVIAIWLLALAARAEAHSLDGFPRRLAYVVNRRTVVDQATREVERLRNALLDETGSGVLQPVVTSLRSLCAVSASDTASRGRRAGDSHVLAISTLRGEHADNADWRRDPSRTAIVVGTVDMIGSRLLFQGYGRGFKGRPLHAAFLGQDSLLVHDEAHLEPAFQDLLESLQSEQRRSRDLRPMRVMALSATSRAVGKSFGLDESDRRHDVVRERLFAPKHLHVHHVADEKVVSAEVARLALAHGHSRQAVIVFLNGLESVEHVAQAIQKAGFPCQRLTGTMRGLERDALARVDPVFARFLPPRDRNPDVEPKTGTVYLVCTSAGEVGVNLSADHLVSDLVAFDRMAQRLGRVNRFGRGHAQVDVVAPPVKAGGGDDAKAAMAAAMRETLALLSRLPGVADNRHDASPAALADIPGGERLRAFSPRPRSKPATDVLFDAWALTTARTMPGRPAVAEWLHGMEDGWEPPETRVAWREEVALLTEDVCDDREIEELLEDYPLKPHELLRDRNDRIFKRLEKMAARTGSAPVWVIGTDGLTRRPLAEVVSAGREAIEDCTIVLPPTAGGLAFEGEIGVFDGSDRVDARADDYDVADRWGGDRVLRARVWDDAPAPPGMRLVRTIDTRPGADDRFEEAAEAELRSKPRFRRWYVRPRVAESEGAFEHFDQELAKHLELTAGYARSLVEKLRLAEPEATAVVLAAGWHDLGKRRRSWQRRIGNAGYPSRILAKSRIENQALVRDRYRHELGSLIDVVTEHADEVRGLDVHVQDLLLHLIAAHHGRARPHFPPEETFDPERPDPVAAAIAAETPRRYGRLQRRFGRWGLAYLESLIRAADALASRPHDGES